MDFEAANKGKHGVGNVIHRADRPSRDLSEDPAPRQRACVWPLSVSTKTSATAFTVILVSPSLARRLCVNAIKPALLAAELAWPKKRLAARTEADC